MSSMARIYPFNRLRYAPGGVPIEKVLTQPYDKISNEMQDRYYALHPNNIDHFLEEIAQRKADIQVDDEYGVRHTTWTISDPETVAFIQREMQDKRLIIADGHHRYETALAYRDEMRSQHGSDRLPMTFFNISSPGLTILPTHRVLTKV